MRGRDDPAWFIENVLRSPLWGVQRDVARAVFEPSARVAWKAAPSVGKTYAAARIVLAFFYLFPDCKIITTAPSWTAVESLLWGEIGAAFERLPSGMGGQITGTRLRGGSQWWAMGLSTDIEERFKGHHAERMLVVVDESPGLKPAIWKAIDAIRAGGSVSVLALGNPTIPSGVFYDAFTSKSDSWKTFTTGAFDSPNLDGVTLESLLEMNDAELDDNPLPNLTTRRWVRDAYRDLGTEHPLWQANILAEFPTESENALFSLAWLEAARNRTLPEPEKSVYRVGIDVAEAGEDETVAYLLRDDGQIVSAPWAIKGDSQGPVLHALRDHQSKSPTVYYDSVGVGAYFSTPLKAEGFKCVPINVGWEPHDKRRFVNLKAELYWDLRERAREGQLGGLTDQTTYAQLAGLRYTTQNARGRIEIESKADMRKRGAKSPDRAESLMLGFARSPAVGGPVSLRSHIVIGRVRR